MTARETLAQGPHNSDSASSPKCLGTEVFWVQNSLPSYVVKNTPKCFGFKILCLVMWLRTLQHAFYPDIGQLITLSITLHIFTLQNHPTFYGLPLHGTSQPAFYPDIGQLITWSTSRMISLLFIIVYIWQMDYSIIIELCWFAFIILCTNY